MAYEKRGKSGRRYLYMGVREGGRVRKVYLGVEGEPAADLAALLMAEAARNRAERRRGGGGR